MAEKDVIMKYLSHISLNQITDFLGIRPNGVQYLSEEIKDIRMADLHADFVLETDTPEIIHVEFQQSITNDTLYRFLTYNVLLMRQFHMPVTTYIIYLGKAKIGEQKIESECVLFKPKTIKVYEMDAEKVIEKIKNGKGNYIEMALMPLMKNTNEEKIVELVDEEAKMKIDRDLKDDVITATLVMARIVYDEEMINLLKRRMKKMFDVDIFEKERKEAIEQGLQQGKLEALRNDVSKLLLAKFKEKYTKDMKEKVKKAETETLEYIVDHIFDITLDEVKRLLQ